MTTAKTLTFKDFIDFTDFTARISQPFSHIKTGAKKEKIALLDTFDGRLFNSGYSMRLSLQIVFIKYLKKDATFGRILWQNNSFPESADEFADLQMQSLLKPVLGVRKLKPCLQVEAKKQSFNLINEDQKIIARGTFILARSLNEENTEKTFCILKPLRGYLQEIKTILQNLPEFVEYATFEAALLDTYKIDLKDRSKPVFNFTAEMPVSETLKSILRQSFDVMRQNEQGILDDTDIEFLHDYRVSGRRMRSALSLIKGILADEKTNQLSSELKMIGAVSGPLRDMDVYLLREEEYIGLLPQKWAGQEIHNIFKTFKLRRHRAYKNMCTFLQSAQYRRIVEHWEDFFASYQQHVINDPPVLEVAKLLIAKRYSKVINNAKKLSSQNPDSDFHNLRIMCKKLRYLMEFFTSLFDTEIIGRAVKQLKSLQDNLGNFNDLSVQIDTLSALLQNKKGKISSEFIQEVAGLIAVLNYKKQQLRNEFQDLFKEFVAEEKELFRQIL